MAYQSKIEEKVFVYSSQEIIWKLLNDPKQYILWWGSSGLSGTYEKLDDNKFRLIREKSPLAGTTVGTIVAKEPHQELTWQATELPPTFIQMEEKWQLASVEGGLIQVTHQIRYTLRMPGIIGQVFNFIKTEPALRRMWRNELRNLKYAAEITLAEKD